MSRTLEKLTVPLLTGWRPIMNYQGADFFQSIEVPEVYARILSRPDGSIETRYACGDGIVTPSLTDVARAVDAYLAG